MTSLLLVAALVLADGAPGPAPAPIGREHIERLAQREAALATILSFLERGEEVPSYQVLLLTAPMTEEDEIEAAVAASIAKAEAIRSAAAERAHARATRESAPPAEPPPGPSEPAPPPEGAEPPAPPPAEPAISTDRLVSLGGLHAADILFETGRAADALPLYEAVLAGTAPPPDAAHAAFRRARCLETLGRVDEAIAAFDAAAKAAAGRPLGAQAAFAAKHLAWKRENSAALDAIAARRKKP